jgi:hypothetical protein
LVKQLQQQGFEELVADLLGGMIGRLIETTKPVNRTIPGLTSGTGVAMLAPSLRRTVLLRSPADAR